MLFITIVEASSLGILNVLSLTGNILVCISVYKNNQLRRTTTNLYIIALALSDLISAVIIMPFSTTVLITSDWVFGSVFCNLLGIFGGFVIYISPSTMGLMAFNRYMRICRSDQQYTKMFSPWRSRALLAFLWIFVVCYTAAPKLAGIQDFVFVPGYAQCAPAHLTEIGKLFHYAFVVIFFLLIPLLTTIFSYRKVARTIQLHTVDASTSHFTTREIEISKSLFVVIFGFMICWIPFGVIVLLKRFHLVATMPRNVELFSHFCSFFSNTINPFVYAGMNPIFRREFRKILCCQLRRNAVSVSGEGIYPRRQLGIDP